MFASFYKTNEKAFRKVEFSFHMNNNPRQSFVDNQKRYQKEYEAINNRYQLFSLIRLAVFLLVVISVGFLFYFREMTLVGIAIIIGVTIFGILVNFHRKMAFQRRQREVLVAINEEEIQRLDVNLST